MPHCYNLSHFSHAPFSIPMTDTPTRKLVLVDGSSFLYRAYHALPPLTNSKGEPTGAVLGVANMLRRLVTAHKTPHIGVVFDAPGRTFRDDLFEAYKSHRPPMPDDLKSQIEPLREIIRAMGFPLIVESGVEADDVIGTLAVLAAAEGYSVVISTGDKDMAQLVNEQITLENTMFNSRLDRQGVLEKFGVYPEQIIDYLALVGDTSDNIPGVPKVGPKTAAKWLSENGTLDTLISRAETIPGKVGEYFRGALDQIPLSRQLATIRCDLELPLGVEDLKLSAPDNEALREWLKQLEFNSWLRQIDSEAGKPTNQSESKSEETGTAQPKLETKYETILTESAFEQWFKILEGSECFAFDTETTSLNYMQAEIVGVSFAVQSGQAAYLPLAHNYSGVPEQLDRKTVLERLRPLLENPTIGKIGQNLKYDANVLLNHGLILQGIRHDTMLESYVLDSTATRHDMDSLASHYLSHETIRYEDVAGKGAKQISFDAVEIEAATQYAAEDADITLRLHERLWPRLSGIPKLRSVYENLEVPLIPILAKMERLGVLVDPWLLQQQSDFLMEKMALLEAKAHELAGMPFNLGSPKQIQTILYENLNLPILKKTPKGQPSTDESVLIELAESFELPSIILEHRTASKLRSTYTEKLPQQINAQTGRVHTSYHQAVTATGRLSSADPNLQNIPIRTEEGRRIRQAFIAPPGTQILAADYSQIELRIMAHFSQDPRLIEAFLTGGDVHQQTAAEVFGVSPEDVTKDQRRSAKAINFGLIYGMSAFGLAKQLGVDRSVAQAYIDRYFDRYPGVKAFMDRTRDRAKELGYVETLMGRRLHIPDIRSSNGQRRQYAERAAINAPMQGTAADLIKRAMIDVHEWIESHAAPVKMIMQVHDELVFEVRDQFLPVAQEAIVERMTQVCELSVPLIVGVGTGNNWDEAH
ncbi:MAG: polymerase [Pseudomonadota bacterium]|jgi:DNA polymerase-1